jgi:hypothetical protein
MINNLLDYLERKLPPAPPESGWRTLVRSLLVGVCIPAVMGYSSFTVASLIIMTSIAGLIVLHRFPGKPGG